MKKIVNYFLKGLLVFVPIAVTIFIITWAFTCLDKIFRDLLRIPIPGLGILVTISVIFLIGFLASNFVGRKLFGLVEKVFTKVPLVKLLYGSIKDIVEAFAGEKKKFDKPVVVSLAGSDGPRFNLWILTVQRRCHSLSPAEYQDKSLVKSTANGIWAIRCKVERILACFPVMVYHVIFFES
jgi:uncharacterized membrane protein